jgi:HAD superfamily hydrolase (TIGR01549 family)
MLKAVIFDFDGTLADTLPIVYKSFQEIFREYKKEEKTDEDIKAMFGPSEERIIREQFHEGHIEPAIDMYHRYYWDNHDQWVKKSMEMERLLAFIHRKGLHLAIMTGKGRKSLDLSLKALNMEDLFEITVTGDEVEKPKPDPEGLLKILQTLNVSADEAVFAGDSDTDIRAGKRAGIETAGVQWLPTFQTPEFTTDPDHVFTDPHDFELFLQTKLAGRS